jgi:hypothetical protein
MIAHELATALVGKHMGRISPITPTIDEAAALMKVGADALLRHFGFQFVALKLNDLLVFVRISQVSSLRTKSHL